MSEWLEKLWIFLIINDNEEQEIETPKLFKGNESIEEQIQEIRTRIIKLENKLKQHAKDEYAHTFEQRQYND